MNPENNTTENYPCVEIIDVEEIVQRPTESGKTILLTENIQLPCFRVIGGKLEPVKKSYKIKLPNMIRAHPHDQLYLEFKIPVEIGDYEIPPDVKLRDRDFEALYSVTDPNQFYGKLDVTIKSEQGCFTHNSLGRSLTCVYSCGWLTFKYKQVGSPQQLLGYVIKNFTIPAIEPLDFCELEYSIYFDPIEMIDKRVICENKLKNHKIKYNGSACLILIRHI